MGILTKSINGDRTLGYTDTRMYNPGYIGWHDISGYYNSNKYDNVFPYIDLIASKFAAQDQYMVNAKGEKTAGDDPGSANLFSRLYYPNDRMSDYDLREAIAILALFDNRAMWRVHGKTTVRRGKKYILPQDITGFTPLFGVVTDVVGDEVIYRLPNNDELEYHQIIIDEDFNPEGFGLGYSPTKAAETWIDLDDYLSCHQKGFFKNGAVAAGMYNIIAKSPQDFQDIKRGIIANHQGAGNNNNVMFNYTPVSADGKTGTGQIEWIPFNQQNKDLALKDLFDQVDKRIKQKFRVPPSMVGDSENNNLSSAQVDRKNFAMDVLEPFTKKRWSRWTMNLNRITGGFGGEIMADVIIPAISEEKKFEAETKQIDAATVTNLVAQGFTAESAIAYVKSGDIADLVEQEKEVEIVAPDTTDLTDIPHLPETPQQQTKTVKKKIDPKDRNRFEQRLALAVKERMQAQVDKAAELIKSKAISEQNPIDPEEDILLTEAMLAVLLAFMQYQGDIEQVNNVRVMLNAGIDASDVGEFTLTGAQKAEYRKYVETVGKSYNDVTRQQIQNTLVTAREQGLSRAEIKKQLQGLITDWRIDRISRTEIGVAGNESSIYSMKNISKELGVKVYKVWQVNSSTPCSFCASNNGMRVLVDENFYNIGDVIHDHDGGMLKNDFKDLSTPNPHPACRCSVYYEVEQ